MEQNNIETGLRGHAEIKAAIEEAVRAGEMRFSGDILYFAVR